MKELFTPIGLISLIAIWLVFMVFRKFKFASLLLITPTLVYIANSGLYSIILVLVLMAITFYLYHFLLDTKSDLWGDRIYWSCLVGTVLLIGFIQYYQRNFMLATGISLLVFQMFGLLSDTYYGRLTMKLNVVQFTSYFLYFPKFISGPIETTQSFLPQLIGVSNRKYSEKLQKAFYLIILGCFKKFVIADNLMDDRDVYGQSLNWNASMVLWFSLIHFVKIYSDFSGLIDIVRGISLFFGFSLKENFNQPFASVSFKDYWSRWNISLSNWVLENLFKPVSFQFRGYFGKVTGLFALIVSFGVISMWHGLTWNYAIFGLFHISGLLLENLFKLEWVKSQSRLIRIIQRIFFIMALSVITLFFNNYLLNDTLQLLSYSNNLFSISSMIKMLPLIVFSIVLVVLLFLVDSIFNQKSNSHIFVLLVVAIILLWPEEAKTFIYEF